MKALRLLPLAGAAAMLLGCEPDYDIRVQYISDPPPEVQIDSQNIFIPKGIAVGVHLIPIEDDEQVDEDVDMIAARPTILGIDRHNLDDDKENDKVLYGREEGSTSVDVFFGDELVFSMSAVVTAPIE